MCIAIPMQVTKILTPTAAIVARNDNVQEVDTSFSEDDVAVGDHVLVFRGTVLRRIDEEEARQVEKALICVESAMRTDSAEGVDDAFADIIENTGRLPEHLQKLVGQKPNQGE